MLFFRLIPIPYWLHVAADRLPNVNSVALGSLANLGRLRFFFPAIPSSSIEQHLDRPYSGFGDLAYGGVCQSTIDSQMVTRSLDS